MNVTVHIINRVILKKIADYTAVSHNSSLDREKLRS
jgi:hypothetical protein